MQPWEAALPHCAEDFASVPDDVSQLRDLTRRLFPVAQGVFESGTTAYCLRYTVEAAFLAVLARFFETAQLSSDWDSLREADVELLVNSLSILCPFDPEEKQALLEAPALANRRETLMTLMEFALRSGGDDGMLQ